MSTNLVLTIIADDQPGLVGILSQTIAGANASWLESRMSQMAGKFAGILNVSVAATDVDTLRKALNALNNQGIRVVIEEALSAAPSDSHTLAINVVANERPGIIREVSEVLAKLGVNIEELHSECMPAPHSAQLLFEADALLQVPDTLSQDQLIEALEALADDLMVEIMNDE